MTRVAVITGAAGGMGAAAARLVGREHHLVISDFNEPRLDVVTAELRSLGLNVTAVVADITDQAAVDNIFAVASETGACECVIHAAGMSPQMTSPDQIMRVNALGTVNVTEASFAVARDGFALVNIASIAGHLFPRFLRPRRAYKLAESDPQAFADKMIRATRKGPKSERPGLAYAMSKNFVIWYSAAQAGRFGTKEARILSVSPGSFDTEMGRLEVKSGSERMLEFAALKRFGTPDEIAELLAFCVSAKASYLTGTDILCDGGNRAGLDLKALVALARQR